MCVVRGEVIRLVMFLLKRHSRRRMVFKNFHSIVIVQDKDIQRDTKLKAWMTCLE